MKTDLQVIASGMCCSLGYCTAAASAAMRAEMEHFQETEFFDPLGNPLLGGMLHNAKFWGPSRFIWMYEMVLNECLNQLPDVDLAKTALLLLLPEEDRPGIDNSWTAKTVGNIKDKFHDSSAFFPLGKAAIGEALKRAGSLLSKRYVEQVVIIGVDSFFTTGTINYYLREERLLHDDNSDGFIPGEGAGAIVVRLADENAEGLHITGIGTAAEPANIFQDELPNRGNGLAEAIKQALNESGRVMSDTHFHISAISGEAYYFKEASLAITRCFDQVVPKYPHLALGDSLGEVGAASGPLILAYLSSLMACPDSPGTRCLAHICGDKKERTALIVEYRRQAGEQDGH